MTSKPRIAVIGAGLGGSAVAILLSRLGYPTTVYEQVAAFSRLGAGINLSPNVTRILRRLGIEPSLRRFCLQPPSYVNRRADTGEVLFDLRLGEFAEERYGAPYLIAHRGDFHALLIAAIPQASLAFGKRLLQLEPRPNSLWMRFADGSTAEADIVIGADGVNSRVREILLGAEAPEFTGYIAHRAIFPTSLIGGEDLDDCAKWWHDDRHFIAYFLTSRRDELYLVTGVPAAAWPAGVASMPGDIEEFRMDFAAFEPRVQRIVRACPEVTKWSLLDRAPLSLWSRGRIVLLGDACHPMKPHMGQGAAMAIEDAAMLVRCLEVAGPSNHESAFALYEEKRKSRTSEIQLHSRKNEWMRYKLDPSWVFSYDVFADQLT